MERRGSDLLLTLALCAGYFLVLLDVTIVNVALPSIGDRLGHRRAVLAGFLGFGGASAVCGAALPLGPGKRSHH